MGQGRQSRRSGLATRTAASVAVSFALIVFAAPAVANAMTYTSAQFALACTFPGGMPTIDATASVTAPATLVTGQSFSPSVQVTLAVPSSWYSLLQLVPSATINFVAFPVDSAGATPASLNWFQTAASETLTSASPSSVSFPASPETVGPFTVTGVAGTSVALTLDTAPGGVLASFVAGTVRASVTCSAPSPAVTIASIPIVAPAGSGSGSGGGPGTGGPGGGGGGVTPPTVSGVSPSIGSTDGGTLVTVSGTGFTNGDAVDFGPSAASDVTVASGTSLTAVAPAGAAGPVDVTVTNAAGTSLASAGDRFTYLAADRTATSVSPRVVGVPGTTLSLDVTCPPTKVSCAGSVLVRTADAIATGKLERGKPIKAKATLGSASFSLAGGQHRTLAIKLSAASQALLRRYRVLSANVEVKAHDSFGDPGVVTVKTLFKAPAPPSSTKRKP